jgi:hypothetical protein
VTYAAGFTMPGVSSPLSGTACPERSEGERGSGGEDFGGPNTLRALAAV